MKRWLPLLLTRALALGCGMIAVTGVLRHTRRFCVPEDEKPRISNSEF